MKRVEPCPRCWRDPAVHARMIECETRIPVTAAAVDRRMKPATLRAMVAREQAPRPDWPNERGPDGIRRSLYRPETLNAWDAIRPGHGAPGRPRRRSAR